MAGAKQEGSGSTQVKRSPVAEKLAKEVHKVQVKLKAKGIPLPGNLQATHASSNPSSPKTAPGQLSPPKDQTSGSPTESTSTGESLAQYLTITPPVLKLNLHGRLQNGQHPPTPLPPATPPTPPPLSHLERLDVLLQPHRMDPIPVAVLVPPLPPQFSSSSTPGGAGSPALPTSLSSQRVLRIQQLLSDRPASTATQSAGSARSTPSAQDQRGTPEPILTQAGRSRHKVQAPYWDWRASGTPQLPTGAKVPIDSQTTSPNVQVAVQSEAAATKSPGDDMRHGKQKHSDDAGLGTSLRLASELQMDSAFADDALLHMIARDSRSPGTAVGGDMCSLERLILAGSERDPEHQAGSGPVAVNAASQSTVQAGRGGLAGGVKVSHVPLSTARSRGATSPSGLATRRSVQPANPSQRLSQAVEELADQGLLLRSEKSSMLTNMFPVTVAEPGHKEQAGRRSSCGGGRAAYAQSPSRISRSSTLDDLAGEGEARTTNSGARRSLAWQHLDEKHKQPGEDELSRAAGTIPAVPALDLTAIESIDDGSAPGRLTLQLQRAVQTACEGLGNDTFTPRAARQGRVAVKRVQSFGKGALHPELQQALMDGLPDGRESLCGPMSIADQAVVGRVSPPRAWTRTS